MMNLKKDSWLVCNDGSQLFKDTVVKFLNDLGGEILGGNAMRAYYGMHAGIVEVLWSNMVQHEPYKRIPILSLEEFVSLSQLGGFKRGDKIQFKYHNTNSWINAIYLGEVEGAANPYLATTEEAYAQPGFIIYTVPYIRPRPADCIKVEVTINGKCADPKSIPEGVWNNLRK
jgi:hypothetical protein